MRLRVLWNSLLQKQAFTGSAQNSRSKQLGKFQSVHKKDYNMDDLLRSFQIFRAPIFSKRLWTDVPKNSNLLSKTSMDSSEWMNRKM